MTALKLEGFMGLVPRVSDRLLPNMCATTARNTKLLSGEARGFRVPRQVKDLTNEYFTVRRVYRIPYIEYDEELSFWLAFDSRNVDIVRSPLVNDAYDRYYWAGDGAPKYNTFARMLNGDPELLLGIPTPTAVPIVTPPGAGIDTTRSYLYTFVSEFGEEGAPSPPSDVQVAAAGTWVITGMQTVVPQASQRRVTRKRIYRTVPGNAGTMFFFVAEVPIADTSYNDSATDDVVALNNILESTSFQPPPSNLEGFVVMPNGYLVGWVGRRLVFSEPFRAHAWPPEYEIGTEFEIVALAVWGNSLVVGTKSNPYIGMGVTPASFTMQKTDAVMPCLSRRGMVASDAGVYYPSINGLVVVNSPTPQVVTQDLLTKEEWTRRYNPKDIYATSYGMQYIAFNQPSFGFIFNPTEPASRLVELDRFDHVEGIDTDRYDGTVYLIYDDRVWEWDPEGSERLYWRWKSKKFHLPKPLNFGALKIKFNDEDEDVSADVLAYYKPYNDARFAAGPLNTINGHVIDGVEGAGQVAGWTEPENMFPIGGDSLYPLNFMLTQGSSVRFIMYANDEIVFDTIVQNQNMVRLPAGFKRDVYQFEMISASEVFSASIAETGKELAKL
jgi:hypothetical protein